MRVALVTPVIPHPRPGFYRSIERIVREDVRGLRRLGHDVEVITTFWNGGEAEDSFEGAPVRRVRDASHRFGRVGRLLDLDYETFGREAGRLLLANPPDVVLTQSRIAVARALRRAGVPVVSYFHHKDVVRAPLDILRVPSENRHNRRDYRAAARILAVSAHGARIAQAAWQLDPQNVRVVHLGVHAPPRIDRSPSGRFRVLYVGVFAPRKGLRTLLDAARALDTGDEVVLIGEGPQEAELRALAAPGVGATVQFLPPIESDDALFAEMAKADVLVLPSYEEGFGMVLVEAMSRGTVVVASKLPAVEEVVGDAGVLVPPGEPAALVRAFNEIRADPARAAELRRRGEARVRERFTWDAHVKALEAVLQEVVDRAAATRRVATGS